MNIVEVKQGRLFRTVDTIEFKENKAHNVEIPLGYDIDSLVVELTGTITVGTAPTTYHELGVPRLVNRIDLFSNGKNKYTETTGLMAALGNFERQGASKITDIATGTGAKSVSCFYRLDRVTPDGVRPKDSALHAFKPYMSKLQMTLQTGSMADMVHTAGSFAVSSFDLDFKIRVEETMEFNPADQFEARMVKQESLIEETIDATKTAHRVKLSTGELMTRGCKIYALDENGALSNSVINNIKIKSGVDVRLNNSGDAQREQNQVDYRLLNQRDGFYYADLTPDGRLNQLYDTRGKSELDLELDVTKPAGGDATVIIVPVQYYEQAAIKQLQS